LKVPPESVAAPLATIFEPQAIPIVPPLDKVSFSKFNVPADNGVKFSVVPFPTETRADPPLAPLVPTDSVPAFKFTVPPLKKSTVLARPTPFRVSEPPLIVPLTTEAAVITGATGIVAGRPSSNSNSPSPPVEATPLRIFAVNKPTTLNVPWSTQSVTVALLPNAVTPIPVNDPSVIVPLPAVNDNPMLAVDALLISPKLSPLPLTVATASF
jgi:hypothetical protein